MPLCSGKGPLGKGSLVERIRQLHAGDRFSKMNEKVEQLEAQHEKLGPLRSAPDGTEVAAAARPQ